MSISNYLENKLLDLVFNAVPYAGQDTVYFQLHIADPGEDGLLNPALNTVRQAVTWAAATTGSVTANADTTWSNLPYSETYTHVTYWDAAVGGNCLWIAGLAQSEPVTAGGTFTIPTASCTTSLD